MNEPQDETEVSSTASVQEFQLAGRTMRFRKDRCHHWARGGLRHSGQSLVSRWRNKLSSLESRADRDKILERMLTTIADENTTAYLWSEFLSAASEHPGWLGLCLSDALLSTEVLATTELRNPAASLLGAVHPLLSDSAKEALEQVILGLGASHPQDDSNELTTLRRRILSQLPHAQLVTAEARMERKRWDEQGAPPPNVPPVSYRPTVRGVPSPHDKAAEIGQLLRMSLEEVVAEPNTRLRRLEEPVRKFVKEDVSNRPPDADTITAVHPYMLELWNALETADSDGVHPNQRNASWRTLVDAAAIVARLSGLSIQLDLLGFVERVLRRAIDDPDPRGDEYPVTKFDESPFYNGEARIGAARGMMCLIEHFSPIPPTWLACVQRLSQDPAPPMRLQVIRGLLVLYETNSTSMWEIIDERIEHESSETVLKFLLGEVICRLRGVDAMRVARAALLLRARAQGAFEKIREECAALVMYFHLFHDEYPDCDRIMTQIVDNLVQYQDEAMGLLMHLRDALTLSSAEPHRVRNERARRRAIELFSGIVEATKERLAAFEAVTEENRETVVKLLSLAERAASELYFGSGSYGEQTELSAEQRARFFEELRSVFGTLADIGHSAVAYRLIETLSGLLHVNPREILIETANVVRRAHAGGIGGEELAHKEIVSLVERFLANHREVMRQHQDSTDAVLDILDVFVERGWPEATALTFRLHEKLYR